MQINMNVDSQEIIAAAVKMPLEDKLKLYEKIKDDIFKSKFESLLNKFKSFDISEEEITREVEHVRSERYKNSN